MNYNIPTEIVASIDKLVLNGAIALLQKSNYDAIAFNKRTSEDQKNIISEFVNKFKNSLEYKELMRSAAASLGKDIQGDLNTRFNADITDEDVSNFVLTFEYILPIYYPEWGRALIAALKRFFNL